MLLVENLENKDSHKDENENHWYSPHSEISLLNILLNFLLVFTLMYIIKYVMVHHYNHPLTSTLNPSTLTFNTVI